MLTYMKESVEDRTVFLVLPAEIQIFIVHNNVCTYASLSLSPSLVSLDHSSLVASKTCFKVRSIFGNSPIFSSGFKASCSAFISKLFKSVSSIVSNSIKIKIKCKKRHTKADYRFSITDCTQFRWRFLRQYFHFQIKFSINLMKRTLFFMIINH